MADDEPLTKQIFIDAPPAEVFPYLTQSEKYVLWMGLAAEIDARPGGIFKVDPNTRDIIFGEFLEVRAPHRIVFTWGWKQPGHPVPAGSTRVEIELQAKDGGTLLTLRHYHLPGGVREGHADGWSHYLRRLEVVLGGGAPGPDPYADPQWRH
jgi:uncharacterized protein YndB with AHSA1/START domain